MEDESLNEEEGKRPRGAPAQGISKDERMGRTEKGSVVEVLKQVRSSSTTLLLLWFGDRSID